MSKKKHNNKTDKKKHHIFGNKQLNEMFCDSREASIDFYRLSVERFDQWFDNPRLKVTLIGERENKIVAFMAGLIETAFELGWNEAMKKMKTPSPFGERPSALLCADKPAVVATDAHPASAPSRGRTQSPMNNFNN